MIKFVKEIYKKVKKKVKKKLLVIGFYDSNGRWV